MLDSDLIKALLSDQQHKEWSARLRDARVMGAEKDEHLVAMNSTVQLLDVDSGVRETFKLVYPEEANIREGKLSVLAPIGASLLSCGIGDAIVWPSPAGSRRLCVEAIQKPPGPGVPRGTLISQR